MPSELQPEEVIGLWPAGPPTVVPCVGPEIQYNGPIGVAGTAVMLRNVSEPTLSVFKPAKPNGVGIIVVPGGGWNLLAWEHEGTDVVNWLTAKGYTAFLLKYRVRATPPTQDGYDAEMMEIYSKIDMTRTAKTAYRAMRDIIDTPQIRAARDAAADDGRRAIAIVRERAAEWGVDLGKIGMLGFSAGAFLTADVAMDPRDEQLAFIAPIYGGETLGRPVPADAPPLFTALAQNDALLYRVVEGLYSDWTDAGRSAEMHIYRRGEHGFGMVKQGLPSDGWIRLFEEWLADLGFA
jgi:acetyl esterase/lipase